MTFRLLLSSRSARIDEESGTQKGEIAQEIPSPIWSSFSSSASPRHHFSRLRRAPYTALFRSTTSSSSCAPSPVDSDYPDSRFQYSSSSHSSCSIAPVFAPYNPELPSPPAQAQEGLQFWTMFQPVASYPPEPSYEALPTPSMEYYDPPPYPPSNNHHYLPPSYEAAPPDEPLNNQPQFQPFLPSFIPAPYLSPPITEGSSSLVDEAWRMASASVGEHVEVPYSYLHPSYPQ